MFSFAYQMSFLKIIIINLEIVFAVWKDLVSTNDEEKVTAAPRYNKIL